jgi:hypothetical protein
MLNPKIEAECVKSKSVVNLERCPICDSFSTHLHYMRDSITKHESKWYECHCGTIWQKDKAANKYDLAYFDKIEGHLIKVSDSLNYSARLYLPIIEEMMYGRKVLHVGLLHKCQLEPFEARGWLLHSIDLANPFATIIDNVESYRFKSKYNLIWLPMVLESFDKPKETLLALRDLLVEDGILFIETPDTNFLSIRSPAGFMHWKKEYNNVMWKKEKLEEYLTQIDFNVVMNRYNHEQRFMYVDTTHILAQRKFY